MFFLFRVKGIFLFLITKKEKYPLKLRCSRNNNNVFSPVYPANWHLLNRKVYTLKFCADLFRKLCLAQNCPKLQTKFSYIADEIGKMFLIQPQGMTLKAQLQLRYSLSANCLYTSQKQFLCVRYRNFPNGKSYHSHIDYFFRLSF